VEVNVHSRLPQRTLARFYRASRQRSTGIVALLLLLPFGLFGAETLGRSVFYLHDVQYYFFPYHKLVVDIIGDGHLPLWNPYAFSGIPLLGDGQTAMFYPPNWLFGLLSPIHAFTVVALLHFSIAGIGTFAYVRSLGLSRLAALTAALAFMFNGFLVSRIVHLSIMAGAALIPLVFWRVERLLQRPTLGTVSAAAVAVALQALAGHPQVPIYTALGVGIYVLVVALQDLARIRQIRAFWLLAQLGAVYIIGYALAAIQLVPWIEFATFSPRAAGASYGFVTFHSITRFDWLLFLFPYGYGGPRESWLQTTPAWDLPVYVWERLAYTGILPLGLALIGLADRQLFRRSQTDRVVREPERQLQHDRWWALVVVLVVGLLVAAGNGTPFGWVVYALPVVGKLRAYARAIILAGFVMAVLAAYGVERLALGTMHQPKRAAQIAAALLVQFTVGALVIAHLVDANVVATNTGEPMHGVLLGRSLQWHQANAYVPLMLAVASAAVLWWLSYGLTYAKTAAMLLLIAVDLLSFAATFNPTSKPAAFEAIPASVEFLRRDPVLFRTASFVKEDRLAPEVAAAQLAISWAIPFGIEDVNGFNSLQPRRYTDVLFGPEVEDVSYGFLHNPALLEPGNRLLSMLNVKYALVQPGAVHVQSSPAELRELFLAQSDEQPTKAWSLVFADQHVAMYRNPDPLERAYFVAQVQALADPQVILSIIRQPGFDPTQLALVETGLNAEAAKQLSSTSTATVFVERMSPNELLLHTQATSERFLVLSEMWFPGWYAEVNGRELPIYRTNYLFRGLVVPAGEHTIRMYYRPTSALIGLGISATTVGVLGLALWIVRRRRIKQGGHRARPVLPTD